MNGAMAIDADLIARVDATVTRFVSWLDAYGETSYDHQSYFAGPIGGRAKSLYYRNRALGTVAVMPMILSEAFLPAARRLFWKAMRFPIADAHYASGFAFLAARSDNPAYRRRSEHFLEMLLQTSTPGYSGGAWGYPFDWVTLKGTVKEGTPFITTLPYVYEAFEQLYRLERDDRWLAAMHSVAEHGYRDYADSPTSANAASCSYSPGPPDGAYVINASAYRAFLLTKAACDLGHPDYRAAAERNLNFVLDSQNADGSWYYAVDGTRDFVDHFHTCFVLKALAKVHSLTRSDRCAAAIDRGIAYYLADLIDADGLPRPFSRAPRMTVYKRELYDFAECVNLGLLLRDRHPELNRVVSTVVSDVLRRWCKADGSFRSRELHVGWDNVPMHRWAQSQMFRSLSFLLYQRAPAAIARN
jgi:hypothetical protein